MEIGRYKRVPVDFSRFTVKKFPLTLFDPTIARACGCGANCLGTLTGVHPLVVYKINKYKSHMPDSFMLAFLKKEGFVFEQLTKSELSNTPSVTNKINSNHVMMISSMFIKNEASWSILYDGMMIHNQEVVSLTSLEFINRPLVSAYVVAKPDWLKTAS